MNEKRFKMNLRKTLDVIVPLVSTALVVSGISKEVYEFVHDYPLGSHVSEIAPGISTLVLYYGHLRRKHLRN